MADQTGMKILWVKTDFLHPTNRGGQIRTLEMLKRLHRRHEVHYLCFDDPSSDEGRARVHEYSARAFSVPHHVPPKELTSPAFLAQLASGLFSSVPVAVSRWRSSAMRVEVARLSALYAYDAVVSDFLFPAQNIPDLSEAILFQHNVEAQIWQRHAAHAEGSMRRLFFHLQARRMSRYERACCRAARRVVAVSAGDATLMASDYGIDGVVTVDTGVDMAAFDRPPVPVAPRADLIFLGSMDWLPNIDGIRWFVAEVLPIITARRPETTLAIVGRTPTPDVRALETERVIVTGTVPDVREWLWGSQVAIVPLRIGGGTRLKIYEAMAAGVPVVSTPVGAEGLDVTDGDTIALAADPREFAAQCLALLSDPGRRSGMAARATALISAHYSWESVAQQFEAALR